MIKMNRVRWILFTIFLTAPLGCSPSVPPAADPEKANESLRAALESWKQGENMDALSKRTPPIFITDRDWNDGWTLKSYTIAPKDEASLQQRRISVKLTLEQKGKSVVREAHYEIDTAPKIVVVRSFE